QPAVDVQRERQGAQILARGERELHPLPIELSSPDLVVRARTESGLDEIARDVGMKFEISSAARVRAFGRASIETEWRWSRNHAAREARSLGAIAADAELRREQPGVHRAEALR